MNLDYIVTSLPALSFGEKPAITLDEFIAHLGGEQPKLTDEWCDLETQLRNAVAACRGRPFDARAAHGCAIYWRDRIRECFAENDIFRRDEISIFQCFTASLRNIPQIADGSGDEI